jgi:cupin fold WbuC family metalloprotein
MTPHFVLKSHMKLGNVSVRIDEKGKSPAFFCLDDSVVVTKKEIEALKKESVKRGRIDLRLSLHKNSEADFHQMVIVLYREIFRHPHKHPLKEETYHVLEGRLGVVEFQKNGRVNRCTILDPKNQMLFRMQRDHWHVTIPLSPSVVFTEAKRGPFISGTDNVLAPWITQELSHTMKTEYMKTLIRQFKK